MAGCDSNVNYRRDVVLVRAGTERDTYKGTFAESIKGCGSKSGTITVVVEHPKEPA